jgi:malate dehydrogenase (oxaloacetate-decarboxylating)
MKVAAAYGIASVVAQEELSPEYIIPSVFNRDVSPAVASAVAKEAARATAEPDAPLSRTA